MACTECKSTDKEWVRCDICNSWYHYECSGVDRDIVSSLVEFHCPQCSPEHGPSIQPTRSKRKRVHYNYAQLDKGIVEVDHTHLHVAQFFKKWPKHPFPVVDGHTLPDQLETPVIIPAKDYQSIEMKIPEGINANYVADVLGRDKPLPVVDVVTQDIQEGWTLGKWVDYFNGRKQKTQNDRTYNVISLEFSQTPLKAEVLRPKYVRDSDLVDKVWPQDEPGKPEVGYYCLMGVEGSYTDFHVDFGGTSVYYHIIEGAKTFLFIPPTNANMRAYENWCKNADQSTIWFPDTLRNSECYRVDLAAGDTMLLPSGWIHAVYTPKDSFVIGGNFLSLDFIQSHLKVNYLEMRIQTPKKFTFPNFHKTLQFLRCKIKTGELQVKDETEKLLEDYFAKSNSSSKHLGKVAKAKGNGKQQVKTPKTDVKPRDTHDLAPSIDHDAPKLEPNSSPERPSAKIEDCAS